MYIHFDIVFTLEFRYVSQFYYPTLSTLHIHKVKLQLTQPFSVRGRSIRVPMFHFMVMQAGQYCIFKTVGLRLDINNSLFTPNQLVLAYFEVGLQDSCN